MIFLLSTGVTALIIVAGIVVLVWLGAKIVQYFSHLAVVGVNVPVVVMRVGQKANVNGYLIEKKRYTTKFAGVNGTLEFFRDKDFYKLSSPAENALGRTLVAATGTTKPAVQQLEGLQVGQGELTISLDPSDPRDFKEAFVPVFVVADSMSFLDMLNLAASEAGKKWYHGTAGNWFPNFFGGQCKGLCDQWADWLAGWMVAHNDGTVCKIEKVVYNATGWGFRHVALRITLCESGEVYYVDGHQNPDNPRVPIDEYEKDRGAPEDFYTTWSQ